MEAPPQAVPAAGEPERPIPRFRYHVFAVFLALAGGVLGIFGAIVAASTATANLIGLYFVAAPIIEEAAKPLGIYLLLYNWPRTLRGQLHVAFLAGVAGLSFGIVEAFAYVKLYVSDPPDWFVTYRFTAPLMLHATASFIFGLGLNQRVIQWTQGRAPVPTRTVVLFFTAVGIHAAYNITAATLEWTGVLRVD